MASPIHALLLALGVFGSVSAANGLTHGEPHPAPLPIMAVAVDEVVQAPEQPPLPSRIPVGHVIVEVVAPLPLHTEVANVTRLLGARQTASNGNNNYPPTILELIKLVEPNPQKPRGSWKTVTAVAISYDKTTKEMIVEYCIEKCRADQRVDRKRKLISYRAPEELVSTRVNERLAELRQTVNLPIRPR